MKTNVLKEVNLNEIKVGRYICLPAVSFLVKQPVWLVEVFESQGYLCYQHADGEEYVVTTCGHRFFDVP